MFFTGLVQTNPAQVTLIRINPDFPLPCVLFNVGDSAIPLMMSGLTALKAIDRALRGQETVLFPEEIPPVRETTSDDESSDSDEDEDGMKKIFLSFPPESDDSSDGEQQPSSSSSDDDENGGNDGENSDDSDIGRGKLYSLPPF